MCGICGVCMTDPSAPVSRDLVRAMTDRLRHRGPDGEGLLIKNNVGFGHRRLSIIDLEGGDQPIFNETGDIGIVFNGEIYNYVELMDWLIKKGHQFRTRSDTEVIVHLYEEFGPKCVERLRGMFAFAIWDARDGSVLLARDRFGIKPLYYAAADDRLVFASELKSILTDKSVAGSVDGGSLEEYLVYGYVPGDRCIVQGVSKLPPGATLQWRNGSIVVENYWRASVAVDDSADEQSNRDDIARVLSEAVRIHLRSDVPFGVLLSGGVDSAMMVAIATRELGRSVKTFTIGFDEEDFDEVVVARLTAERYKTDHHELVVRKQDLSVLPEIVWHLDEPFADPSAVPTYYVCREAARHVKVCLTGDGADEIFGGYGRYRRAMSYRLVDWLPGRLRSAVCVPVAAAMPQSMFGKGFVERVGSSGAGRYLATIGIFTPLECAALVGSNRDEATTRLTRWLAPYFGDETVDTLRMLQLADQNTYLPDDILVKADRMSMQNSLELRPPFLDHEVAEIANRMPSSLKVRDGVGKAVLRDIARDLIPPEVLRRKKTGFGIPIKHWFRGDYEATARETLLASSSRLSRFVDQRLVERMIVDHQKGMRDLSRRIWSLLILEQWLKSYDM